MAIHLIHGFNVSDGGASTINKIVPYIKRLDPSIRVEKFQYGWTGLVGVRLKTGTTARELTEKVKPGDVAITHSNGANIANEATWTYGAPFKALIYINPALNKGMPLALHVEQCIVYHSDSDWAVKLSSWLFAHDWGKMGATGYVGENPKYHNIPLPKGVSHSGAFEIPDLLREIAARAISYAR